MKSNLTFDAFTYDVPAAPLPRATLADLLYKTARDMT